jgi:hypothetical protein
LSESFSLSRDNVLEVETRDNRERQEMIQVCILYWWLKLIYNANICIQRDAAVRRGVSQRRNCHDGSYICGTSVWREAGIYPLITARVIIFNSKICLHTCITKVLNQIISALFGAILYIWLSWLFMSY